MMVVPAGGGAQETWRIEGAGAPHDIAVAAAPMPVRGTGDRALALFVAETKPRDSWLRKYLFVPLGELAVCCALRQITQPLQACRFGLVNGSTKSDGKEVQKRL